MAAKMNANYANQLSLLFYMDVVQRPLPCIFISYLKSFSSSKLREVVSYCYYWVKK